MDLKTITNKIRYFKFPTARVMHKEHTWQAMPPSTGSRKETRDDVEHCVSSALQGCPSYQSYVFQFLLFAYKSKICVPVFVLPSFCFFLGNLVTEAPSYLSSFLSFYFFLPAWLPFLLCKELMKYKYMTAHKKIRYAVSSLRCSDIKWGSICRPHSAGEVYVHACTGVKQLRLFFGAHRKTLHSTLLQ